MKVSIDSYPLFAPNESAAKRWEQMMDECIANLPAGALGGLTPWEANLARVGGSAVDVCTGRLVDAYACSGGLLSVFTDRPREEDDDVWQELAGRPDADALWNDMPCQIFANLTPAEVWAGGGAEELRLAKQFMTSFAAEERRMRGSEAELIHHALLCLRDWQRRPMNGRTPAQIVGAERRQILARKRRFLARRLDDAVERTVSPNG